MLSLKRTLTLPPPYTRGSVTANRLGLQPARMLYEATRRATLRTPSIGDCLSQEASTLARDGVVAIPGFLSAEDFAAVLAATQQWRRSPEVTVHPGDAGPIHRDHHRVDWTSGGFRPGEATPPWASPILELFAADHRIDALAEVVMGRSRNTEPPDVIYEHLSLPTNASDDSDNLLVLHADRHYPTAKVYFALTHNGAENGAFEYCLGSHRMSVERLRFERDYSVARANLRNGRSSLVPSDVIQNGRIGVSPTQQRRLGLVPTTIHAPPNTLIVANNRGFHRRGEMQPGHDRTQLRLIFHQRREPASARLIRAVRRR